MWICPFTIICVYNFFLYQWFSSTYNNERESVLELLLLELLLFVVFDKTKKSNLLKMISDKNYDKIINK